MTKATTAAAKKSTPPRAATAAKKGAKTAAAQKTTAQKTAAQKTAATTKTAAAQKTSAQKTAAQKTAAPRKPPAPKTPAIAAKTLEKLKVRLEEERETYMRQAEELAAEAEALMADREPGDTQFDEESGEGDTINVERERDLALSASARQSVEEIDEALARMKAGTYGICQRCGNRIPIARLEAVPQASLCIECKSRQERRR